MDFSMIRRFNAVKIKAPLNEEDLEKTMKDLNELKEALIYWGKIIQRQSKIKFIRKAKKISQIEEFTQQAEEEEKFIFNEKQKFDSDEAAQKTHLNLDKLKIAQQIDKELRMQLSAQEDDGHRNEEEEQQTRQSQRPRGQKFREII